MAWGGSLNKKGSDYIRRLMEAERVIKFLEKFKEEVSPKEKDCILKAIEAIIKHYTKIRNEKC